MDDLMQNIRQESLGIFIIGGSFELGKVEAWFIKGNTTIRF